jgi:hypothetical protein
MRLEYIPLLFGALVGFVGAGLVFDAWTPDYILVRGERRRRPRPERDRGGEAAIGFGVLCMAAAFMGRDTWSYSVLAVIAGTLLLGYGVVKNRSFLSAAITNRGELRRREGAEGDGEADKPRQEQ